jgi:hypothetical protein
VRRAFAIGFAVALLALAPAAIGAGSSTSANRRAARTAAARLLAAVRLPAGASQAGGDPSKPAVLGSPPGAPLTPALVDEHSFWRIPEPEANVLDWVQHHPPARGRQNEGGFSGSFFGPNSGTGWVGFRFAPVKGVLYSRELTVEVAPASSTVTAVRVDAQVVWYVNRPASDRVPAGIRTVTVIDRPLGEPPSEPETVSAAGEVRRVVSYVNQLPPAQPGVIACPDDRGPDVELDFNKAASATPAAIAIADGSGCGFVTLRVSGHQQPALTGGPQLIKWLGSLLGRAF